MKKILLLIFIFAGPHLHAQNIHTTPIRWNVASAFDANSGEMSLESSMFISHPDHLEWKTADGSIKYTLKIVETNGSWTSIANNGQVIFEVDQEGQRGTVQFSKNGAEVKVKLMLLTQETPIIFELTISNTELL